MIAPALTLVLFNKKLRILPINVGRTNVQNSLDFVTALLVDRHKRGRLRHRGAKLAQMLLKKRMSELQQEIKMNKRDLFNIFKMSIFTLAITYLFVLSKFNFDFSKVNILKVLGFFPIVFISLLFCFYLGRMLKDK